MQRILSLSRYVVVLSEAIYAELAKIFILVLKYLCAILKVLNYYSRSVAKLIPFQKNPNWFSPTDSEFNIKKQQRMSDRTVELAAKFKKTVENSYENDVMKKVKIQYSALNILLWFMNALSKDERK